MPKHEYGDEEPVYSYYHSDCEYCKEHKQKVKDNPIVGYKERQIIWREFQ